MDVPTGMVRNGPVPTEADLEMSCAQAYRVMSKGSANPRKRQILRSSRRAREFIVVNAERLRSVETVLDVGSGTGEFVLAAKFLEKKATGLEPNIRYSAYCRDELELNVTTDFVAPDRCPSGMFDLTILSHVLEDMNDPVGSLSILWDWLAPNGLIFVAVTDIDEM